MALIPAPITKAPPTRRKDPRRAPAAIRIALPDARTAAARESSVRVTSYRSAMGNVNAIMPMKCIDQMPMPIASAPPISHAWT